MRRVDVCAAVRRNFRLVGSSLFAAGKPFDLGEVHDVLVIAIGKAATPMYETAIEVLQAADWPPERLTGIVVSPQPVRKSYGALTFFSGAHPTPDEISKQAAISILDALRLANASTLVIFLVSGGSSAMVELPLDPAMTQEDVAIFYRILVGSGLSIAQINTLRKHFSAVKGGRLAEAAAPAMQCTLIVSDVPADSWDIVGSGPSLPDLSSEEDCRALYLLLRSRQRMPTTIERFFESDQRSETPKPIHNAFLRANWTCILSSDDLSMGAASEAQIMGMHVEIDNTCDDWPAEDAASYLLDRSAHMATRQGRSCLISIGEVSVRLPEASGRGGRNQHLALLCAISLNKRRTGTVVLSAGTDGIDGNTPAAGAIADCDTCRRALEQGIDPFQALEHFDSFRVFDALADTITVGPTGNNLRDLRILLT